MSVENLDDILLEKLGKETVLEFIQKTIKKSNNVEKDILDIIKYDDIDPDSKDDRSSQGFVYERLWDLCIKFGVTDLTLPSLNSKLQTSHIIDENPNKSNIEFQENCWTGNKLYENPGGYLYHKVKSYSYSGYSDITFLNRQKSTPLAEELYLISVKYFKEEKEIDKYDIGKLCTLLQKHKKENRTIKLYIFVKNKKEAIKKFSNQNSSSGILIKYINPGGKYEHIYDLNDLQNFYFKLKKLLEQYNYLETRKNIEDFQTNYLNVLKGIFIPRFHQELFILKINELINKGEKNILVGAIPRSGKSFIMAGTILDYVTQHEITNPGKKMKFLMMTPAPNETFGEYKEIFNKYIEFEKLGIQVVSYEGSIDKKSVCTDPNRHCVIIISKQKLGWSAGSKAEKLLEIDDGDYAEDDEDDDDDDDEPAKKEEDMEISKDDKDLKNITDRVSKLFGKNPDIDVMFLDEAHFGMSTEKSKKIVDTLNNITGNTVKIYVTATYNKPLQAYGVNAGCKLTWDMNDIKTMQHLDEKNINDNNVRRQFGERIYSNTLEYYGDKSGLSLIDKLKSEYAMYPKPYLITSVWDKDFLKLEKEKLGDTEYGWNMNKLFITEKDSGVFVNEAQVRELMRYYFGYPNKDTPYDEQGFYRSRGILPRIRNICLNKCRTLQPQHKTSQLWFLPVGTGKIKNKVKALVTLLTDTNEFKDIRENYHFFVAIDIEDSVKRGNTVNGVTYMNKPKNIKREIEDCEKKIKEGEIKADNLIILTGNRLQLGISLRNVDIVTLWNSISSSDAIFQMLFRSMTEVDTPLCDEKVKDYCDNKRFGFMVDMNPQRALTDVYLFGENLSKKTHDNIQRYRQITDLINIDQDVMYDKLGENPNQEDKDKFVAELFNKLYDSWNISVENIVKIMEGFSWDMSKLETLRETLSKVHLTLHEQKNPIQEPVEDESIKPGKMRVKLDENDDEENSGEETPEEKEINVTKVASEILSEFISLLNIFTLYADKGSKCILTNNKVPVSQIALIDDIDNLKREVYKDLLNKEVFLKILNGRLTGNSDTLYSEKTIEIVLSALESVMDKQVVNKIIMAQKKHYYTINDPKGLLEYINGELKPKEKEKNENGEVFTPLSLVKEMLDKLDEAYAKDHGKSIFTEVGFRWFDPAAGIGNFPIIVYQNLMEGLKLIIKDEEERRKHILENMIYASELTPKNVFIYEKIFCGNIYKLNIYEGDTLKMDAKREFKLPADFAGFDVVMGNPPFQGRSNKKKIYINFVIHTLDTLLNKNAYFMFITPKQIIRILLGEQIQQQQTDKMYNILYLNTRNAIKTEYFKNIGSDFMYFILQNNEYNGNTIFVNNNNVKNIIQIKFKTILPLDTDISIEIVNKLLVRDSPKSLWRKAARIDAMTLEDEKKNDIVKIYDETHKNKLVIFMKTKQDDDVFYWTSKDHPDMFKYKVLYPSLGERYMIDEEKNLFTGNTSVLYILCNSLNECKNIVKLGKSKLFTYLKKAYTGKNPIDSVWNNLIKPSSFDIKIDNDEDIYKYFSLTKQEIYEIDHPDLEENSQLKIDKKKLIKTTPAVEDIPNASHPPIQKKTRNSKNGELPKEVLKKRKTIKSKTGGYKKDINKIKTTKQLRNTFIRKTIKRRNF